MSKKENPVFLDTFNFWLTSSLTPGPLPKEREKQELPRLNLRDKGDRASNKPRPR